MEPLLEIFSFRGRANRGWYFWHILLDDVVMFTALVLLVLIGTALDTMVVVPPVVAIVLAGIWAGCAMTVKRLHDLERPGWHWWLLLVPFYNVYLGLVLIFAQGTIGPNQYGPDPLEAPRVEGYLEG